MNCRDFETAVEALLAADLPWAAETECRQHAAGCAPCHDVLTGTEALLRLRGQAVGAAPPGLAARLVDRAVPRPAARARGFWQGAAAGAAVAAGLAILVVGVQRAAVPVTDMPALQSAEFRVALDERRLMDLAIESDRPLANARISIELSGGVELDGYGLQRVVEWNADLKAGINRLSLPLVAVDPEGGRMVVRLSHPQSEKVFVVRLRTEA